MKLPEFVFITPNRDNIFMGAGFVEHTIYPFYIGRVIKVLPSPSFAKEYTDKFKPLVISEVADYSILIAFNGKLSYDPYPYDLKELETIFDKMANFFYEDRILSKPGYYKRYKLF